MKNKPRFAKNKLRFVKNKLRLAKNKLRLAKNKLRLDNTAFLICLLSVLLLVFNFIAFLVYQAANPEGTLSVQIWNYLESTAFQVITAGLGLPIILFLLERNFKIVQTVRQKREEERKEKRWECIEQTTKIWNQLWDLTSEIVYFNKDADKEKTIEDLLIRLRKLTTSTEDVLNMWYHRFPDLPDEYYDSFLMFFNTELNSTETVAWCIRQGNNEKEIDKLQNSLKRIVGSINYLTHHRLIDVLKHSMQLLELKEANAPSDEQKETESLLNKRVEYLKDWANDIEDEENEQNTPFSFINTADAKALRGAHRELRNWMLKNPGKDLATSRGYKKKLKNFESLFFKTPHERTGPWYSKEFVMRLANWISFEREHIRLLRQVGKQPKKPKPKKSKG